MTRPRQREKILLIVRGFIPVAAPRNGPSYHDRCTARVQPGTGRTVSRKLSTPAPRPQRAAGTNGNPPEFLSLTCHLLQRPCDAARNGILSSCVPPQR